MNEFEVLNRIFDWQLYSISKGLTHKKLDKGVFLLELEKVKEWKSKFGYEFNVYSNDHFVNGEPHFHFDHKEKNVACKISFSGEIFKSTGKGELTSKILKELTCFLSKEENRRRLINFWNQKNPELKVG